MQVTSQPGSADGSLLRVQESDDGTNFVLEFTLDANDAGTPQTLPRALRVMEAIRTQLWGRLRAASAGGLQQAGILDQRGPWLRAGQEQGLKRAPLRRG